LAFGSAVPPVERQGICHALSMAHFWHIRATAL
jgi:hypothetical protein